MIIKNKDLNTDNFKNVFNKGNYFNIRIEIDSNFCLKFQQGIITKYKIYNI